MLGLVGYSRYRVRFIETIDSTRCVLNLEIEINENRSFNRFIGTFLIGLLNDRTEGI